MKIIMYEVIKVVKENNSVIKRALLDRVTVIYGGKRCVIFMSHWPTYCT
jgi:hypothetical protein